MGFASHKILTSTIPLSGTTGSAVQCVDHFDELGIVVPAISSATLKFQGSYDGFHVTPTNFTDIFDTNGNVVPNWAANTGSRALMVPTGLLMAFTWIRPVLSQPQNSAAVTIQFVLKRCY